MTKSSPASSTLVIDASLTIWSLLPMMSTVDVVGRLATWREAAIEIYAPSLWLAECTSAIRRYVHASMLTAQEGSAAIEDLLALDVEVAPITAAHCRAAFAWAAKLGQARAYDSFYLALAEELETTFFTADRRLANNAQQMGLSWVRWIGS